MLLLKILWYLSYDEDHTEEVRLQVNACPSDHLYILVLAYKTYTKYMYSWRIMKLSYQRTFVPRNDSSIGGTFIPWNL